MNNDRIKISFYDEIVEVNCPKSLEDLKKIISKCYNLKLSDNEEFSNVLYK